MVKPRTLQEQLKADYFIHDERLVLYFATSRFDSVWRQDKEGNVVQAMPDLPQCKDDCASLREAMRRYLVLDDGPEQLYKMDDNPDLKRLWRVRRHIRRRLMDNPDKNFLIVYVLASHGIQSSGKQVVLLNEFHAGTGFYRAWGVENDIRDIAETFPNSYQIAFFACCRELWNSEDHGGCIGGTKEKAEAYYKELAAAKAN